MSWEKKKFIDWNFTCMQCITAYYIGCLKRQKIKRVARLAIKCFKKAYAWWLAREVLNLWAHMVTDHINATASLFDFTFDLKHYINSLTLYSHSHSKHHNLILIYTLLHISSPLILFFHFFITYIINGKDSGFKDYNRSCAAAVDLGSKAPAIAKNVGNNFWRRKRISSLQWKCFVFIINLWVWLTTSCCIASYNKDRKVIPVEKRLKVKTTHIYGSSHIWWSASI